MNRFLTDSLIILSCISHKCHALYVILRIPTYTSLNAGLLSQTSICTEAKTESHSTSYACKDTNKLYDSIISSVLSVDKQRHKFAV